MRGRHQRTEQVLAQAFIRGRGGEAVGCCPREEDVICANAKSKKGKQIYYIMLVVPNFVLRRNVKKYPTYDSSTGLYIISQLLTLISILLNVTNHLNLKIFFECIFKFKKLKYFYIYRIEYRSEKQYEIPSETIYYMYSQVNNNMQ